MENNMNSDMNLGDNQLHEERLVVQEEHKHEERVLKETTKRNDYFLGICILVAGLLISGSVIYTVGQKSGGNNGGDGTQPTPTVTAGKIPQIKSTDVILGDVKAPVTFIEFADYQCPFCHRFETQSMPQIRDQYIKTGKVKVIYRDFAFLGPESIASAASTRCAADQAKFWEYHDALLIAEEKDGQENNGNLTRDLFVKLASGIGLNAAQFGACLDSKKYDASITTARTDAGQYGVQSTPTLFVNNTQILGAQPFEVFQAAIEAELKK